MSEFEKEFERFLQVQQREAKGQRLEMLKRDLTGTKKLLESALWPVLKSFDGLMLEYEMVSSSGVHIFGDVFCGQVDTIFESEGYVAHAENITRDRFSFERMRVRTIGMYGYKYMPFSWDELDKKPEACRRAVYELLGKFSGVVGEAVRDLGVYEREVLRCALRLRRPFRLADVCGWLQLTPKPSRAVVRSLMAKQLVKPCGSDLRRNHTYLVSEKAAFLI